MSSQAAWSPKSGLPILFVVALLGSWPTLVLSCCSCSLLVGVSLLLLVAATVAVGASCHSCTSQYSTTRQRTRQTEHSSTLSDLRSLPTGPCFLWKRVPQQSTRTANITRVRSLPTEALLLSWSCAKVDRLKDCQGRWWTRRRWAGITRHRPTAGPLAAMSTRASGRKWREMSVKRSFGSYGVWVILCYRTQAFLKSSSIIFRDFRLGNCS